MTTVVTRRPALVVWLTWVLAIAHLVLGFLHASDRVLPSDDPPEGVWQAVLLLESPLWPIVHLTIGALLVVALVLVRTHRWWLLGEYLAAAGTIASVPAWGFWLYLLFEWGAASVPPAAWTAPALAVTLALPLSALCAWAWIVRGDV